MTQPLELWFDFASTYSYVAAMRAEQLCAEAGVGLVWRPFLLGPIFQARGYSTSPFATDPLRGNYMLRDLERLCQKHGLPWRKPTVFPQRSITVGRVACALLEHPKCGAFVRGAFTAEFGEGLDLNERSTLETVLRRLELDPHEWLARAESPDIKAQLRTFSDEAARRSVFGAPNLFVGDELFFGQDRLEDAIAWARRP
jgi:2-hydroxychromene-2-carboxylate isomerase